MIVITEGKKWDPISWLIRKATGSIWTHCFIVFDSATLVEAWFPRVRRHSLRKRMRELAEQDRRYVVLDWDGGTHSGLPLSVRVDIAEEALKYEGRWYAVFSVIKYLFTKKFSRSRHHPFCSRLIAAAYYNNGRNLFPKDETRLLSFHSPDRLPDVLDGYPTPVELFASPRLIVVNYNGEPV